MTIKSVSPLGFPWQTSDPFLFCVHHFDAYPEGKDNLGPDPILLRDRNLGHDFGGKDGWSMYHGDSVPGFPQHPHRGFETVTVARQGFIDHHDSLGAKARFGEGDVQWMTAGKGIVHSEAFPLVHQDRSNTTELFQIWLNLPKEHKLVEPHFGMIWHEDIPEKIIADDANRTTVLRVIAGTYDELTPPSPPPKSWAAEPEHHVAIWTLRLQPRAHFTLPAAKANLERSLYVFRGNGLTVDDQSIPNKRRVQTHSQCVLNLINGDEETEILLLQGRPITQPVAQHGPFVMNYPGEIRQAMLDYQRTGFGGWPWETSIPVHPRTSGRFALHGNGHIEIPSDPDQ